EAAFFAGAPAVELVPVDREVVAGAAQEEPDATAGGALCPLEEALAGEASEAGGCVFAEASELTRGEVSAGVSARAEARSHGGEDGAIGLAFGCGELCRNALLAGDQADPVCAGCIMCIDAECAAVQQ